MGTFSGTPFRSDSAGDWGYELADAASRDFVRDALTGVIGQLEANADEWLEANAALKQALDAGLPGPA
ncbi:DUF4259 domain-containing protein [Agreia sp. COWG]|uniref:DUF4259 domain-containing protein n=1 Tax=Agreia sp. COWG TaxID=2773266 RepID=UPI001928ACA8|nr:DUF4259 domain-containing protein [Agreia sp. COWG]CAD6010131.1 protein of unknown function [Agreia sp. COWG]